MPDRTRTSERIGPTERFLLGDLSSAPLDARALVELVRRLDCGAVVSFEGTVRTPNHGHHVEALEYEAWIERVPAQLSQIAAEVADAHGLGAALAVHRVGRVEPGEPAVVVVAAGVHRDAAFLGARELIDRVKSESWIWKKELRTDGEVWIEGCG